MKREFQNYCRHTYEKVTSAGQSHKHKNVKKHVYENVQPLCMDGFFFCQYVSNGAPPYLIQQLVEVLGADVNHADDEGRTPLHLALMRGRHHYAKYLIRKGAKVDVSMNSTSW